MKQVCLSIITLMLLGSCMGFAADGTITITIPPDSVEASACFVNQEVKIVYSVGSVNKSVYLQVTLNKKFLTAKSENNGTVTVTVKPGKAGTLEASGYVGTVGAVPDATKSIDVVSLDFSDLWWFGGEVHSKPYPTEDDAVATGGQSGATYDWSITAGNALSFPGCVCKQTTTTDNLIHVYSINFSAAENEEELTLKYKGATGKKKVSVARPKVKAVVVSDPTFEWGNGFKKVYSITIVDNIRENPMRGIEVTEKFLNFTNDINPMNWSQPKEDKFSTEGDGSFKDGYGHKGNDLPLPTYPTKGAAVFHYTQQYFVGSKTKGSGLLVSEQTVQFYTGDVEQQNRVDK
jgi:hypothetical protein